MELAEAILLYSTIGVFAVVVGAIVAGFAWAIASGIEIADDVRRNGWW